MKKTISWLVIAAFFSVGLGLVAVARADNNGPEMERILSPEMIKEFRVMKREGNALYGIRLSASSTPAVFPGMVSSSTALITPAPSGLASSVLEKIEAPEFIHEYEKIRRVGNSLWGILKAGGNSDNQGAGSDNQGGQSANSSEGENSGAHSQAAYVAITPDIASCVATAINTKDQAVIAEINTASASLAAAISTRSTCQQAAVQSVNNQQAAVVGCAQAFQTSRQEINSIAKQAQNDAWTTYSASLQACQASSSVSTSTPATTATSSSGEINIEDGGNSSLINTVTNNGSDN